MMLSDWLFLKADGLSSKNVLKRDILSAARQVKELERIVEEAEVRRIKAEKQVIYLENLTKQLQGLPRKANQHTNSLSR